MTNIHRLVLLGLVALALLCLLMISTFAHAQGMICRPWEVFLDDLAERYGEVPAFIATAPRGVVTFTVNPTTGTWTMLVQPESAVMCMVAAGDNWAGAPAETRERKQPGQRL